MNKIALSILLLIGVIVTSTNSTFAQYEHKFSSTLSGGVIFPFGVPGELYADDNPYVLSKFEGGSTLNLGLSFNASKAFSLAFNIGFAKSDTWNYEYTDLGINHPFTDKLSVSNFSLGVAPKLFFNSKSKVRVYSLIEVSANYLNLVHDEETTTHIYKNKFGFGIRPALGLDIALGEKMGIFIQHGLAMVLLSLDKYEEQSLYNYNLQKDNFNHLQIEIGFRYDFLKSKKI